MKKQHSYNVCDHPISPDREILEWERWITIRKEETESLAARTGRPAIDLTMNILENMREDKERKITLEHAQIKKKATVRDGLWEQPERLKQRCHCEPVYELHRTKTELGHPHIMEHIGVPKYIQETEKGLTGTSKKTPFTKLNSDYNAYREKREKDLKAKILKIDPYRPDIGKLMIKGSTPVYVPKLKIVLPQITLSSEVPYSDVRSIYAIQINKSVLIKETNGQVLSHLLKMKDEPWHELCTTWSYYFNCPVSRAGRAKLYLKNLGTVSLRYCWKKIKVSIPFIPEEVFDQVFFFNKNEDVIYPGQSKHVYFTYASNKPGIYNEGWELNFYNVTFFETMKNKLIINLSADSTENIVKLKKKANILKCYLNKNSLFIIAREMLNEIVAKASSEKHQIYPYRHLFLEAQLFEMKNPVCFYHQTEVGKIKGLYTEMTNTQWDLSITSWREAMMQRNFDERMKYYELLRISHRDFLKPWYEGEDLKTYKYRAVMLFLGQLADKFDIEYARIPELIQFRCHSENIVIPSTSAPTSEISFTPTKSSALVRNLFYIHINEHVANTIELCAGVLSSLDLNRWIHFDFCKI